MQQPPIVGDEVRAWRATRSVRRAANAAATTSLLFLILFIVSAQIPAIRATSPWAEDPYDAVLSIVFLVLPVVMIIGWARARRWRGQHATPPAALRQQLRGATVAVLLVVAGLVACLAALVAAAAGPVAGRSTTLDVAETPPIVGLLLLSVIGTACLATGVVVRAWRLTRAYLLKPEADPTPDLFDDFAALSAEVARSPGMLRSLQRLGVMAGRSTLRLARPMRTHPWPTCIVVAIAFGIVLSTWHSLVEGVPSLGAAMVIVPVYAGLGAVLVVAAYATVGRYLELIRHEAA